MFPTYFIAIVALPIIYFFFIRKERKEKQRIQTLFPEYVHSQSVRVWRAKLARAKYYINKDDIGVMIFAVKTEQDSPYGGKAWAVVRDDGKLMGYMPKKTMQSYEEWAGNDVCTGIGQVNYDEKTNHLWANLIVFAPETGDEALESEINNYISWATKTYGADYIPQRYKI